MKVKRSIKEYNKFLKNYYGLKLNRSGAKIRINTINTNQVLNDFIMGCGIENIINEVQDVNVKESNSKLNYMIKKEKIDVATETTYHENQVDSIINQCNYETCDLKKNIFDGICDEQQVNVFEEIQKRWIKKENDWRTKNIKNKVNTSSSNYSQTLQMNRSQAVVVTNEFTLNKHSNIIDGQKVDNNVICRAAVIDIQPQKTPESMFIKGEVKETEAVNHLFDLKIDTNGNRKSVNNLPNAKDNLSNIKVNTDQRNKVECKLCNRCYSSKYYALQHIRVFHNRDRQLKCDKCDEILPSSKHLYSHVTSKPFVNVNISKLKNKQSLCQIEDEFHCAINVPKIDDTLDTHLLNIASTSDSPLPECKKCDKIFTCYTLFKFHLLKKHIHEKKLIVLLKNDPLRVNSKMFFN
ncbi:hypothetical protein B4U80_13460 [Leptotrombidium deliense]|uniref:C2H2-type domain-containing protein n=1 Tax=Leptotrombidium deliense TaxID=299467 RepID=A0A443S651_9ACAR|nr:hypothetical protein B4U80_13460 [Leptotrombidium deliense]